MKSGSARKQWQGFIRPFRVRSRFCGRATTALALRMALLWGLCAASPALAWYRDPQISALQDLGRASARPLAVDFDRGFPRTISLDSSVVGPSNPAAAARSFLAQHAALYRQSSPDLALAVVGTHEGETGDVAVVFGQTYRGLRVFGARLIVGLRPDPADPDRHRVLFTAGALLAPVDLGITPALSPDSAADTARLVLGRPGAMVSGHTELVVFDPSLLRIDGAPRLAWALTLEGSNAMQLLVDASNAQILFERPLSQDDAGLSGLDLDLRDAGISFAPHCKSQLLVFLGDESGLAPAGAGDLPNSLLWEYARQTYLDFHDLLGRHSWDAADIEFVLISHLGGLPNAYYDSQCKRLTFHDQFVSLDVVAHEFTHGVIDSSPSQLVYKGQSGALNESYADLMASLTVDTDDWLSGEDRLGGLGAIRSIQHPAAAECGPSGALVGCGQPDQMSNFLVTNWDYGGVHINSGIPNRAHYLMSEGGTQNTIAVVGMGRAKVRRLAYFALRFLSPTAQFSDARAISIAAANVWAAFGMHGFTFADVCSVRNAFAAVQIGMADEDCDGFEDAAVDLDQDFVLDFIDNCLYFENPLQADWDQDGVGDSCDDDPDQDSVPTALDKCPNDFNPGVQTDTDGDGIGDVCDDDRDNDGIVNWIDNCLLVFNPDQLDTDHDDEGNACDPDYDGDGFSGGVYGVIDNCPWVPNPDQLDTDFDGLGDACDGCPTVMDNTQVLVNEWTGTPKPWQPDSDQDGIPDACDTLGFLNAGFTLAGMPVNIVSPVFPDGLSRAGSLVGGAGDVVSFPIAPCDPGDPDGPAVDQRTEIVFQGLGASVEMRLVDGLGSTVARLRPGTIAGERGLRFKPDCTERYRVELMIGVGFPGRDPFQLIVQPTTGSAANPWQSTPPAGFAPPASMADADRDGLLDAIDSCPAAFDPANFDADTDGHGDACDNCPWAANTSQIDRGGVGAGSAANGRGDACECGDVNDDGRVTLADSVLITRSLLSPPTATLARAERCDVGGSAGCTMADAVILRRALLAPPTASIAEQCGPATP